MGVIFAEEGQHEAAVALYDETITQAPSSSELRLAYSSLLRDMGKAEASLSTLQTAAALDPAHPGIAAALVDGEAWFHAEKAATRITAEAVEAAVRVGNFDQVLALLKDHGEPKVDPAWY